MCEQEMFDMSRPDHKQFHDLCKKLLAFEPHSRVTAATAMEHEFFHLDITPEYTEESLLLYPDAPIPPPTMPAPINQASSKPGVASVAMGIAGMTQFPRSAAAADAVGPAGPSTFHQGMAPNADAAQQDLFKTSL